jgi:hemoglobin-like flavoprotein
MYMDQQTISVVQSTWKSLEVIAPKAAELFYRNLFAADPTLQSLFKSDMHEQGKKLMQVLGTAVSQLNDLDPLVPALQALGARHKGYGVRDAHYETVGSALLKTLGQGLGSAFTPEVEQAWALVYKTMATVMIEAGKSV